MADQTKIALALITAFTIDTANDLLTVQMFGKTEGYAGLSSTTAGN